MAALICYVCRWRIVNASLIEHIRRHHPAVYAHFEELNKETRTDEYSGRR